MNNQEQDQLAKELRKAGASDVEARELLSVAADLKLLKGQTGHHQVPGLRGRWLMLAKPALVGLSGLTLGMFMVIASQSVLPTSWVYPVQSFSDAAATAIHPQYRASVMMKRAQQVNALVAQHAASQDIIATLASYNREARAYKLMPHTSYAAFGYCKTNLQQAADSAEPMVRQAIDTSLQSLETT